MLRSILCASLLLVGAALAQAGGTGSPDAVRRPNIVLIMADDMGWSDVGCYGGEIRTPHIDRLASEGVRFSQFYNNAKCTTTRASLLTGLYPRRRGALLKADMVTIAEVLRPAGYHTALSGKWHLGAKSPRRPIDRGFEEAYGLSDGCCNFFDPSQPDPKFKGGRVRVFSHNGRRIDSFPDDFYTTDAFTDHAVSSIERFAQDDRPFFLHVCYTAPHYPLHALPEDIARYSDRYDLGWDHLRRERHARQAELGLVDPAWQLPARDPEAAAWADAPHKEWQALRMAVYAAMVDRMDQGIGRILAALDRTGLARDTLVLFLSDNGGCAEIPGGEKPERIPGPKEHYTTCGPGWAFAQNTPFRRYKTWMHEGGIATPLVVRWPAVIQPGTVTDQVGHIIDLLPTFAAAARVEYPQQRDGVDVLPCEGLSLLPVLAGRERAGHDALYWEFAGNRAVRQGRWKACWDRKVKRWELYDLVADRTETRDLADAEPERLVRMSADWEAWARRTGVLKMEQPAPAPAQGEVKVPGAYKRVHQQALRHVQAGRLEQAAALLDAFDADEKDAESAFLRVLLAMRRSERQLAATAAAEAVRRGLPPGRLVAGPRELIAGLDDVAAFRELTASAGPLVHGPMLGSVSDDGVRIWVRTADAAPLRVVARGGGREVSAAAETSAATDFTAVVQLKGLAAATDHVFQLWVGDDKAADGSFSTAPVPGAPSRFTLAFGGGAGYVPAHEHMWDTISAAGPDLLLLLGDNVYIDDPKNDAMQRYCYYRRQSVPAFRQLVGQVPVFTIWDDHDFGTNDCSGGPLLDDPPWKLPVWRRFVQNWANPGYGGGESTRGCWYSFVRGDVEFFMLDGRYYRTPPGRTEPDQRSMLGPVQKAWLEDRLRASKATFKVLCSPVPWDYRTKGDSLDTWNGFRAERQELFDLLARERIGGVLLLSADRHRSDAWRIEREGSYDLYEFNSSRLTNQHVHPTRAAAELSYNDKQSFGLVEFDTSLEDPTVTYTVRNIDGEDVGRLQVRLSQLR